MSVTARRFNCARCHQVVVLCRACDHGNRYCFDGCAAEARAERQREAAARYRGSRRARFTAAIRQARHRARGEQEVTHRSSLPELDAAQRLMLRCWLLVALEAALESHGASTDAHLRCSVCDRVVDSFLRADFLRPRDRWRARARSP